MPGPRDPFGMSDATRTTGRPTALVTGASAGIGRALAEQFARHGHDVALVARREGTLEDIAAEFERRYGITAHVLAMDLAEPDAPAELHAEIDGRGIRVDVLVNNVGIGTQGTFTEIPTERDLDQLRLNAVVPTHLTKLFGRKMVERGEGKILNVSSTAAFQPGPLMAVYYASKAYSLSLSEALTEELRDEGVTVTALCPGPVRTEFQERAEMTDTPLGSGRMQSPEAVARAGYEGLMAGEAVVIPSPQYRLLALLTKLTPRSVARTLAKRINASR